MLHYYFYKLYKVYILKSKIQNNAKMADNLFRVLKF